MKKTIKYTSYGVVIGFVIFVIFHLIKEYFNQKKEGQLSNLNNFFEKIDSDKLKNDALKGAIIGGLGALSVLAIKKLIENFSENNAIEQQPFYAEKFVKEKLKEIKQQPTLLPEEEKYFNLINRFCASEFERELFLPPMLHGSRAKKVSYPSSSDYDVALIFNNGRPIEETLWDTFERLKPLENIYNCKIRDQRFSIGITFEKRDGSTLKIDILPAKISSNYNTTKDVLIWDSISEKRQKTNIVKQNSQLNGNSEARDTILLLKHIKNNLGLKLPSPILNKIISDVIKKKGSNSKFKNLELSVGALAQKFDNTFIKDPFNSNNNYLEKYSQREKRKTQNSLLEILSDLINDKRNIQKYL